MNENGANFNPYAEPFFPAMYRVPPPQSLYPSDPAMFSNPPPTFHPPPDIHPAQDNLNMNPSLNQAPYQQSHMYNQGQVMGQGQTHEGHPEVNRGRGRRGRGGNPFPTNQRQNQTYQGQGYRGRGGRGSRSRAGQRPNYSQTRQKYHDFHQNFQHDNTQPISEPQSLHPSHNDHRMEEEQTYNQALNQGQGHESGQGGARPKQGQGRQKKFQQPNSNSQTNKSSNNSQYQSNKFQTKYSKSKGNLKDKEGESGGEDDKENSRKNKQHRMKFREFTSGRSTEQLTKVPPARSKYTKRVNQADADPESQRGTLIEQLSAASYECMVCCDVVRQHDAVWSCGNCYHVYHLRCIKRWARSPAASVEGDQAGGWRCPACQNVSQVFPHHYTCFCSKVQDPEWNRFDTPHSCGEVCSRSRGADCTHLCNILCHPGPCPPCLASITKSCDCGKTKQAVKCGTSAPKCSATCGKTLNCGRHECQAICHPQGCNPCEVDVHQACYCGQDERDVKCGSAESFSALYSCTGTCNRTLECGNHPCERPCHPGSCDLCKLRPQAVTHCACGKRPLEELGVGGERKSCTDPIPTCGQVCGKAQACGPRDKPHTCVLPCHDGPCPPCKDKTTAVACRCAVLERDFPCKDAVQYNETNPFICDKRCNKKRQCGRHRCPNPCCVEEEHPCDLLCGGKLSCGLHRCEEPCHRGNCPTCWHVSFDELHCECGAEVLFPPIACGTKPPPCAKLCSRQHDCNHPIRHACHSEVNCPPCTELTERWCMGKHELRRNIPCHLVEITCGLLCGKDLACGVHACIKTCHKGLCVDEGEACSQPCSKHRAECGHPCGAPCHGDKPCPRTPCQTQVQIRCKCGNRGERAVCQQGAPDNADFQKMATVMMAMKMADVQSGQSFDISGLTTDGKRKPRQLECSKECAVLERNKRLALALEIKNPDVTGKLGCPSYNVFLRDFTKQSMQFVLGVEKQLSDLVLSAQKSKQPRRSHAFPAMNSAQRRLVHELCEIYGCQSQSYDVEPKKNVVATAVKDKCWQPSVTLSQVVMRELNPKRPVPIPHIVTENDIVRTSTDLPSSRSTKVKMTPWGKGVTTTTTTRASNASPPPGAGGASSWATQVRQNVPSGSKAKLEDIDYFDMDG